MCHKMLPCATTPVPFSPPSMAASAQSSVKAGKYYDSKKKLSQLRESIHLGNKLAERENLLKKASHQVNQCKTARQKKWNDWVGYPKELKDSIKAYDVEFDCNKFSTITDFSECCKVIDEQLHKINGIHGEELVSESDLQETQRQLLEKEVILSFYGQGNAGKSTILNAVLRNKLLPINKDPETSVRLVIRHTYEGEEFVGVHMLLASEMDGETFSDDVKQNYLKRDGVVVACGTSGVHRNLGDINKKMREDNENTGSCCYVLKTKIPLALLVPNGWRISLMDNPGFDEYSAHVSEAATQSLRVGSSCLYITTYEYCQKRETAIFFQTMYKNDKDVFKNQRLSIVINKMDLVCPMTGVDIDSGDEEMSEEIVVAKVQRFIQRICNCPKEDIPKESIIPVYGLWAYRARMLTKEPNSEKRKKLVVQVLSQLNNQPSGQGEDPAKCCGSKPVDQLARELEEISSIRKLERRLQDMSQGCIRVWVKKIKNDYSKYLETCKSELWQRKETLEKETNELEEDITRRLQVMIEIFEIYRGLIVSTQDTSDDSLILKELKQSYDLDVTTSDLKFQGEKEMRWMIKEFKEKFTAQVMTERYGPRNFIKDLGEFGREATKNFDKAINARSGFNEMLGVRNFYLNKVTADVSRMATLMDKLCPNSDQYSSMLAKDSKDAIPLLTAPDLNQAVGSINAPNVYSSLFERIKVMCNAIIAIIENLTTSKKESINFSEDYLDIQKISEDQEKSVDKHHDGAQKTTPDLDREKLPNSPTTDIDCQPSSNKTKNEAYVIFDRAYENTSTSTSEPDEPSDSLTYKKWTPEMDSVVVQLHESIDKEIQTYFDDFQKIVLEEYWKSYCELTIKKLENFNDSFNNQLDEQTARLNEDINLLQKKTDNHQLFTYQGGLAGYLLAQFLTVVENALH